MSQYAWSASLPVGRSASHSVYRSKKIKKIQKLQVTGFELRVKKQNTKKDTRCEFIQSASRPINVQDVNLKILYYIRVRNARIN